MPDLHPILQDIANYLTELQLTLLEEYEAFLRDDIIVMRQAGITEYRLRVILDDLRLVHVKLLEHAGLDTDQVGMMEYIALYPESNQLNLDGLWQRIEKLERNCQRLERINSLIIKNNRYQIEPITRLSEAQQTRAAAHSARVTTVYDPSSSFQAIA